MSRLTENLKRLEEMGKLNGYHMGIIEDSLKEYEKEIRAKAIDEFYNEVLNFEDYIEPSGTSEFGSVLLYSNKDITNMICKIAEQMKAGGMNE